MEKSQKLSFAQRYNVRWMLYTLFALLFFVILIEASIAYGFNVVGQQVSRYEGQSTFATQEDYAAFKEILAGKNVTIGKYEELSSAYPILVSYEVTIPSNITFPYAESQYTYGGKASGYREAAAISLTVACGVFLIYAGLKALRKIA